MHHYSTVIILPYSISISLLNGCYLYVYNTDTAKYTSLLTMIQLKYVQIQSTYHNL